MRQATYSPAVAMEMKSQTKPPSYQTAISAGNQVIEEDGNINRHAVDQTDGPFHHVDGTDPPHHGQVLENYSDMGQDE